MERQDVRYHKVLKHGSSQCIVIPAPILRDLQIKRGDYLDLKVLAAGKMNTGETVHYIALFKVPIIKI